MKTSIHYSESYGGYRVSVGKSTYYTSDKQDAKDTCQHMLISAGVVKATPAVKKANVDLEDNW